MEDPVLSLFLPYNLCAKPRRLLTPSLLRAPFVALPAGFGFVLRRGTLGGYCTLKCKSSGRRLQKGGLSTRWESPCTQLQFWKHSTEVKLPNVQLKTVALAPN